MTAAKLATWVERPETHRAVVGDYDGQYALGVTDNPVGLLLRVAPADVSAFPTHVRLDGADVPVTVRGDFRRVVPQAKTTPG